MQHTSPSWKSGHILWLWHSYVGSLPRNRWKEERSGWARRDRVMEIRKGPSISEHSHYKVSFRQGTGQNPFPTPLLQRSFFGQIPKQEDQRDHVCSSREGRDSPEQAAEEQSEYTPGPDSGSQTDRFLFLVIHKNNGTCSLGHFRFDEVTCNLSFEKKS